MTDIMDDQSIEPTEAPATTTGFSRRKLLIGGGVGALALVAAACGSDDDNSASSGTPTTASSDDTMGDSKDAGGGGDVATAKLAASLEVLAVGTYKAALDAATAGKLGAVPPAVGEYVKTAMDQHQTALDAWNGVITGAGGEKVTEPPADLKSTVDAEFGKVKDVGGAAKLALMLEQIAADTYMTAVPAIQDKDAVKLAAGLQCVCQEHAAILHYVLGEYPVPDTFQKGDQAYTG